MRLTRLSGSTRIEGTRDIIPSPWPTQ
jgi:hypothetical protein